MLSREEQLKHEIENKEIDARDAIELVVELETYDLLADIAINLDMNKDDREFLITNMDYCSVRVVGPMLELLEDEDEIEHFITKVMQRGFVRQMVVMINVNKKSKNPDYIRKFFKPVIKLMAGRDSDYIILIGMILERSGGIKPEDFSYFLKKTSLKDLANIVSDKAFVMNDVNMKQSFDFAIKIKGKMPASHGLILNAIDKTRNSRKWSFLEKFNNYMYECTGRDKYLPQTVNDIFIF